MNEYTALLQAILDEPDDDVPRLVLADWLEENGASTRAEFLRTQIDYEAALPWDPLRIRLETFQPELITGRPWMATLPHPPFGAGWSPGAFRRGFGWSLRLNSLLGILDSQGQIFEQQPVGELHLPSATLDEWKAIGRSNWLRKVHSVRFFGTKTPVEPMRVFAQSPHATGLERFHFENAGGPGFDDILAGIVQSPIGKQIRSLTFNSGGGWLPDLIDALDSAPVPQLQRLAFFAMQLSEVEAVWLAKTAAVSNLRELVLLNNPLKGGLAALVQSPRMANLQSLTVWNGMLTPEDIQALVESPLAEQLCLLDLSHMMLGPEVVAELVKKPWPRLRVLRLRQTGLDNGSVKLLTEAEFWNQLVEIDLGNNWLSDTGANWLRQAVFPWDLTAIKLDRNSFLSPMQTMLELHFPDRLVLHERV